jgi:hypothetical protein
MLPAVLPYTRLEDMARRGITNGWITFYDDAGGTKPRTVYELTNEHTYKTLTQPPSIPPPFEIN